MFSFLYAQNERKQIRMLNHITTNQCRMLLQKANFIKTQYPKRIKEFQQILQDDRSLIEMSVDISAKISATKGSGGKMKDLEAERIKNQVLIRNLKTEILYMDNQLLQIKILENMMIRLKSKQVKCIEETYFKRNNPVEICKKLYISRSAYYRYLNKGIDELTKLYNHNISSEEEENRK